ncbi:MAG TPA: AarF/ABC1/UbiB kinase family protein [Nevskiaceae bacterium]|nr:AarF/ABC1/UbiB kinase family protein [Nevskiaceae bacterium]
MGLKTTTPGGRAARLFGAGARTLGRRLVSALPVGDATRRRLAYWQAVGEDWTETLGDLRGAAMKLGQLASQYSDLLPPPLAEQLQKLQRAAEPLPWATVSPWLDAAWGPAGWAEVETVEPEALAAASIGQVHPARLVDGREVVVKIRYPGVEAAVASDLSHLRRLIGLSKLLPLDGEALDRLMEEVRQRLTEETDYRAERRHLQALRDGAASPGVRYPQAVESLCSDGVLVLERLDGEALGTARHWPQAERDALGLILARWLLVQLFEAGLIHADPHAGNFAFRRSGPELIVYDYGCVKRIPPAVMAGVRALLAAAAAEDWPRLHAELEALGGLSERAELARLQPLYAEWRTLALARLTAAETFDFADPAFIEDLRAAARRQIGLSLSFKPVTDLVFVLRALSGHYWLLRALGARVPVRGLLAGAGIPLPPPTAAG